MNGFVEIKPPQTCPVCGHSERCKTHRQHGEDLVVCFRQTEAPIGFRRLKLSDTCGVFVRIGSPADAPISVAVRPGGDNGHGPDRRPIQFHEEAAEHFAKQITDEQVTALAEVLGVTCDALRHIGVGHTGEAVCFPERDEHRRVVGINCRGTDGTNPRYRVRAGDRRGLVIPDNLDVLPDPVLLVEGPSDVAACLTMGLAVVGRPNNSGGGDLLAKLLRDRTVLVVGENDKKPTGAWPGRDGAVKLTRKLATEWGCRVAYALPPNGAKDVRDYLIQHAGENPAEVGARLLAYLQEHAETIASDEAGEPERKSQAARLVELTAGAECFHHGDTAYATVDVNGHNETHGIRSKGFRLWLAEMFYRLHEKPPNAQAMADALATIEAKALFDGSEQAVFVRVAEQDGAIYLDLVDDAWRVVRVDAKGWSIVDNCPVRFLRPRGMLALPTPVRGGRVDDLRPFINAKDDQTWTLAVACLVAALRPRGPYPILDVSGEHGSAKTTFCRMLRALVDPNEAPLRAEPKDERDLMIAANNAWMLAFDNLSYLPVRLSNALCRLSNGGGFATRELYTDDGERIFNSMRPVIVNGIEDLATRPDLLDRAVTVTLPSIPEDQRRSEDELWPPFNEAAPGILGALLEAVSVGLRNLSSIRLSRLPRMADFAKWASACEPALGLPAGAFLSVYSGNREEANQTAIEANPVGPVLLAFLAERSSWIGTASDLLRELNTDQWSDDRTRKGKGWPKTANYLSGIIRRIAPNLRAAGIDVTFHRQAGGKRLRTIRLEKRQVEPSLSSLPSQCAVKAYFFSGISNPTRQRVAPAGSNRSGGGGDDTVEASDGKDRQAVPRADRP